jgi:glycosyltransferase involved in cell wall biosynthesis
MRQAQNLGRMIPIGEDICCNSAPDFGNSTMEYPNRQTLMSVVEQKSIAIYYPAFLGGGAETVALWMLEALQQSYPLTLYTVVDVNFDRLNALYGTHLSHKTVTVKPLFPSFLSSFVNGLIANSKPIRMLLFHLLIRYLKQHNDRYPLLMSAYNAMDFGKTGLQYIHWIKVLESSPFYNRISNFSIPNMQSNLSIANSYTVADFVKKEYGCESTVIYPPVVMNAPDIAWEQKQDAFICSGRLTEAKQPHKVISILKQVRDRGFDIKLHLTGGGGGSYAWKYQNFVKKMVQENSDWVTLYEDLEYADYVQVMSNCRYGIHFKQEPFGISIAEMVKAGAIPFVRSQGGQIEIVGDQNRELLFDNEQEAVEKIVALLSNPGLQTQLRNNLLKQKHLFSTDRFMQEIRQVVAQYFTVRC